jgi:hypothetical protein
MASLIVTFSDLPENSVDNVRAEMQALASRLGVAVRVVPVAQDGRRDEVRASSGIVGVQDDREADA